jgi:nucleoid DNA-binding protein
MDKINTSQIVAEIAGDLHLPAAVVSDVVKTHNQLILDALKNGNMASLSPIGVIYPGQAKTRPRADGTYRTMARLKTAAKAKKYLSGEEDI